LLPTAHAVRAALERLSERLVQAGCTLVRTSPLLPDLAAMARLYTPHSPYKKSKSLISGEPEL